jgi:hypothetical protein
MTTLQWIALGVGVAFALSAGVALMVAAVLGSISSEVSRVLEAEAWAVAPSVRRRSPALVRRPIAAQVWRRGG